MASIAERITDSLGVERNVVAASGAVFLVGLGEELWKKFLPKYLESLGASVAAVGLFGTAEDLSGITGSECRSGRSIRNGGRLQHAG